ncbi:MAG: hypothetical protein JNM56_11240 [Planctomycetia bacterium]|nr:hypothetical protein [Planctomycetia bacterium]
MSRSLAVCAGVLALASVVRGEPRLDYPQGEGMVLQSGVKAVLHGTAKPGEKLGVVYRAKTYPVQGDKLTGRWQVELDPGEAGGPFALSIQGDKSIDLKDVHVADLLLASVLGDGMVLQRGDKAPVFGTARPGDKVVVTFRDRTYAAVADARGAWRADVVPGAAGGPFPMTIQGRTTLKLPEVYVGEVWVCSGQSNMHYALSYSKDAGKLVLDPPNPGLRLQKFPEASSAPNHPALKFGGWQPAHKKAALEFSGTGYYFGAALQEKLQVPVGLIHSAYNATGVSEWTPDWKLVELKAGSLGHGQLYSRQIKSIQPFAIRGVIWYQGEANAQAPDPLGYDRRQAALIEGWRKDWGQGDFPFLFVQLARIGFGTEQTYGDKLPTPEQREIVKDWARVRDQQRRVLTLVPNTAMAVSYDLTTGNLHPPEKKQIAERLALAARALAYGEKLEYAGPLLASARREGDEVIVRFTHATGLTAQGGAPRQFEAATADGKFQPVKARVDGEQVRLAVNGLKGPLTIRYAYREWPDGNLVNAAGLPASPFVVDGVK